MRPPLPESRKRPEILHELRRLLPRTGGGNAGGPPRALTFGLPALESCLPAGGLACGAVHEIRPADDAGRPAALGFAVALLGRLPGGGPVFFIASRKESPAGGRLHGHGLNGLGLDPARAVFVQASDDRQALWAMEEALRSGMPCAVAGLVGNLDRLAGQRLHLAAGGAGIPLLLLRPPDVPGANVAATRWRVGAAAAARDRFGLITHWRWRVRLERCRNGRTGEWQVEFDHAAYRFRLPAAMADPALPRRAGARFRAAGAG
jgi:protein ImuA